MYMERTALIFPAASLLLAGSALAASPIAGLAFTTTFLAPMGTLAVWTLLDYARSGKPTAVGAATAIVVGLVAVTPAAGFIGPMSAIVLGGFAAVPSYLGCHKTNPGNIQLTIIAGKSKTRRQQTPDDIPVKQTRRTLTAF